MHKYMASCYVEGLMDPSGNPVTNNDDTLYTTLDVDSNDEFQKTVQNHLINQTLNDVITSIKLTFDIDCYDNEDSGCGEYEFD